MSCQNILRLWKEALRLGEPLDLVSGDIVRILPQVDDTGEIHFGDGTTDLDVKVFLGTTSQYVHFDVGNARVYFDGLDFKLMSLGDAGYLEFDTSAQQVNLAGPVRLRGANDTSPRFELTWVAGAKGIPQLNAVTDPPAGDTYNTAAMTALLIADREFEILGTNASSDDVTAYAEGGIKLETDGASNDQVIILPNLNTGQSAWTTVTWGTDKQTEWSAHIKTGSAITKTTIWAGLKLTNTSVTATDNDQAFFRYDADTNSGKWQAVSSIGGTDDAADAGVTVAINTEYHLKITIDSSRLARFYINGALVKTSTALTDATDLIPYVGIQATEAAAKHMYVFGQAISRVLG